MALYHLTDSDIEMIAAAAALKAAGLKRLVADGRVQKLKKPVRYVASALKLF